jgi:hypothetical protein
MLTGQINASQSIVIYFTISFHNLFRAARKLAAESRSLGPPLHPRTATAEQFPVRKFSFEGAKRSLENECNVGTGYLFRFVTNAEITMPSALRALSAEVFYRLGFSASVATSGSSPLVLPLCILARITATSQGVPRE